MADRATPNLPARDFSATAAFYAALGFTGQSLRLREMAPGVGGSWVPGTSAGALVTAGTLVDSPWVVDVGGMLCLVAIVIALLHSRRVTTWWVWLSVRTWSSWPSASRWAWCSRICVTANAVHNS